MAASLMRLTIIDQAGKVSFVAPCQMLDALVAACARTPTTLDELLDGTVPFSPSLRDHVQSGLAVFDEHNTPENYQHILSALEFCRPHELPVFRVMEERTLQASLSPVQAGVVVFNLLDKRIVQIHNTYNEIRRKGRVRIVEGGQPTNRVRRYELPADWSLVPGGN
ncbi:MAG: hypothetical protein IT307_08345 [Chloroflexi bacterium]|nr:hypothetical protein [Chloroflexota bacterium]